MLLPRHITKEFFFFFSFFAVKQRNSVYRAARRKFAHHVIDIYVILPLDRELSLLLFLFMLVAVFFLEFLLFQSLSSFLSLLFSPFVFYSLHPLFSCFASLLKALSDFLSVPHFPPLLTPSFSLFLAIYPSSFFSFFLPLYQRRSEEACSKGVLGGFHPVQGIRQMNRTMYMVHANPSL